MSEFARLRVEEADDPEATTIEAWDLAVRHAVNAFGDKPLDKIVRDDAAKFRRYILNPYTDANGKTRKALSKTSYKKQMVNLKSAMNVAVEMKLLHQSPFAKVKVRESDPKEMRLFGLAELEAMIEVSPHPWQEVFIRLGYTSGLRTGEMLNLLWEDVDLEGFTVRVRPRSAGRVTLEDGSVVPIFPWHPKTKHGTRTVPIPGETAEALAWLKGVRKDACPYVFLTVARLRVIEDKRGADKTVRSRWLKVLGRPFDATQEEAAKRLGSLNWEHGSPHDLRKTFGTMAAAAGVPMTDLQKFMGHASIEITARYYVGLAAGAGDRLRSVFGERPVSAYTFGPQDHAPQAANAALG